MAAATGQQEAAFQAWLERKRDQQKRRMEEAKKQEIMLQEVELQRLVRGRRAYQQWMDKRQELDEIKRKELMRRRQLQKLIKDENERRMQQSKLEYVSWKAKKVQEKRLDMNTDKDIDTLINSLSSQTRATTPSLPGYISVWACDNGMANGMLKNVSRPKSCTLIQLNNRTN